MPGALRAAPAPAPPPRLRLRDRGVEASHPRLPRQAFSSRCPFPLQQLHAARMELRRLGHRMGKWPLWKLWEEIHARVAADPARYGVPDDAEWHARKLRMCNGPDSTDRAFWPGPEYIMVSWGRVSGVGKGLTLNPKPYTHTPCAHARPLHAPLARRPLWT